MSRGKGSGAVPKKPKKPEAPKKRNVGGRRDAITEARVRVLVAAIGAGLPKIHAARLAKITDRCLQNWLNWGEAALATANEVESDVPKERKLHVRLFLGVRSAVAKTMQDALNHIAKAGEKNWQAGAWLLTRLCPSKFADNRRELADLRKQFAELLKQINEYQKTRLPETPADTDRGAEAVPLPGITPEPADMIAVKTPSIEPPKV